MAKKYSENFERDYKFYFDNRTHFTFCGTLMPKFQAMADNGGKCAKEVFFLIDSNGKNYPTSEPQLLNELLTCKASVNFHIKQWAEGIAEGTLPFCEFAGDAETLEWVNEQPVYGRCMAVRYGFPDWVVKAVEAQKFKLLKEKNGKRE